MAGPARVQQVGVAEARKHLSRLLRSVEAGAVVVIARNGTPNAELRSPARRALVSVDAVIADARSLRAAIVATGGRLLESPREIVALVVAGRRLN